jgi:hypothetical protein
MVTATTLRPGDTVRDKQLGLRWEVIAYEGDGMMQIERNGVTTSVSMWELELITSRPSWKCSR